MTTELFADASFWIALASRRDEHHDHAAAWARHVAASGQRLLTTEAVLWEWLNGMSHPDTRSVAAEGYGRCHNDPLTEVVGFGEALCERAVQLYSERRDKATSPTGTRPA